MLRWSSNTDVIKARVVESMDWVIEKMYGIDEELTNEAVRLKRDVSEGSIKEVVQAINAVNGCDYGGSWNSHWYQCTNGHPYFIVVRRCRRAGALSVANLLEGAVIHSWGRIVVLAGPWRKQCTDSVYFCSWKPVRS